LITHRENHRLISADSGVGMKSEPGLQMTLNAEVRCQRWVGCLAAVQHLQPLLALAAADDLANPRRSTSLAATVLPS
jgi:hypothetical protein